MQSDGGIRIRSFEDWLDDLLPGSLIAGPAVGIYRTRLPERVKAVPDEQCLPTIEGLLNCARIKSGSFRANAWKLEPIYLRGSSAEEKRNKSKTTGA